MKYPALNTLSDFIDQEVTVAGWVHHKRNSGKIKFLLIRDGSTWTQCILTRDELDENSLKIFSQLTQETSIEVTGLVTKDERSVGGVELQVKKLSLINTSSDFPISPKEHGIDHLLSHRHLWLRSKKTHAILKIRDCVVRSIRNFFYEEGFTLVDTPIFTPSACEGTSTLFETPYFDQKAFLTQSGQLYAEAAALAFGKAYCFGPTFRAEKSKTRRHLTEFWMVEPEAAFFDLNDDMDLAEKFMCRFVDDVLKECQDYLKVLERDVAPLEKVKGPFPRIKYSEAIEILNTAGMDIKYGDDFGAPEETHLGNHFQKPLFITHYPADIKAFYMKPDPENPKEVLAFDCIGPEGYGELIGGSQREENLEALLTKVKEHNLPREDFEWYIDLRKFGSVPHAGFGLGLERTISWICGLDHLREAAAFPRMMYRLTP